MAWALFPPVSRLASSWPCCCCCWMQGRWEDVGLSSEITNTFHTWHFSVCKLSHCFSTTRFHWRIALFMTLHSPLEKGMFWKSWVWLYSQKMRSVGDVQRGKKIDCFSVAGCFGSSIAKLLNFLFPSLLWKFILDYGNRNLTKNIFSEDVNTSYGLY